MLPEDMYSVMKITRGLSDCASIQYLWNLTRFVCCNCVRLSKMARIFSYK